jgi:hypothetical protein
MNRNAMNRNAMNRNAMNKEAKDPTLNEAARKAGVLRTQLSIKRRVYILSIRDELFPPRVSSDIDRRRFGVRSFSSLRSECG